MQNRTHRPNSALVRLCIVAPAAPAYVSSVRFAKRRYVAGAQRRNRSDGILPR